MAAENRYEQILEWIEFYRGCSTPEYAKQFPAAAATARERLEYYEDQVARFPLFYKGLPPVAPQQPLTYLDKTR